MRFPKESLDDFKHFGARKPAPPPEWKSVELTGEVEIVEPLKTSYVFSEKKAAAVAAASFFSGWSRLSWYHRSLALSGATTLAALVVGTATFIGIYGPPAGSVAKSSDVATNFQTAGEPDSSTEVADADTDTSLPDDATDQDGDKSDLLSSSDSTSTFQALPAVPSRARARAKLIRRSKPRVLFAAYRPRPRPLLHRPQLIVSSFVPTTLVIFVENGEVKTRIEPWLSSGYKSRKASE